MQKYLASNWILTVIMALFIVSCSNDDRDLDFLEAISDPSNLALQVAISQDNTGLVTLTPSGESSQSFVIDFGDGSEVSEPITPGENITHVYAEGTFQAVLTAFNLDGDSASINQDVVVSFRAPENLLITISPEAGNAFGINLSASADFAASFQAFFGDVADEEPTPFGVGETIQHTYPDVGTYTVRVVALSGGAETLEGTEDVEITNPVVLPIDFESTSISYDFIDFGGAISQVIDNPDASGENTSSKVAEFLKEAGAETFAGTVLTLGDPIDFSEFTGFTMSSWSPIAGATVKLKLENATDADIATEVDAVTSTTNSWETLSFDFSGSDLTQEYSKIIVFYDFGNTGADDTFYYDNIAQANISSGPIVTLPVDFEDPTLPYNVSGFEGADSFVEANAVSGGINTSSTVVRTTKTVGAQFFAGTTLELGEPIDFSEFQAVRMKTYSPKAGIPVRLKLENSSDSSIFMELDVNTTTIDTWETLTWDFSGFDTTQDYDRVIVFFEFVVDLPGDGSTYYFDDIELDSPPGVELPVDFEDTGLTYNISGFEGADSAVEANAVSGGINTSATVVRTTKTVGAQFFAGTILELDAPIDFSSTGAIKIKTYSPKAGIPVRLKLETAAGGSEFVELDVNTTAVDTWEELTWDFSGLLDPSLNYVKVIIFFEFVVDLPGDGSTYYFDDIQLAL